MTWIHGSGSSRVRVRVFPALPGHRPGPVLSLSVACVSVTAASARSRCGSSARCLRPRLESSEVFTESAVNPAESELRLPTELGWYVCDVDAVDRGVVRSEGEDADAAQFIPCVPHMGTYVCEDVGLSCPLCRGC